MAKTLKGAFESAKTLRVVMEELNALSVPHTLNTDDMCYPSVNINMTDSKGGTFYFRISAHVDELYMYCTNDFDYSEDLSFPNTTENIKTLVLAVLTFEYL